MNETNLAAFNRVQNEQGTGKRYEVGKGIVDIPKTTTPTVTTTTPAPKRTPGLLDTAKEEQARIANDTKTAQRQADSYAAQMRQARIDAINTSFAPRIQREQVEGEGRMSRVAALNFKSGVVGSGVDTTRTGEQKGMNDKALQAIEDEKAIAINEAFGWADKLGKERAALLTEQAQTGAEANVKYAQDKVDTAMNALNTFAKSGKITSASDLKDVDPNTYDTLREVSGMSDAEVDAYLKVNTPEGTYQWNAAQISGNKMMIPKVVDGKVTMESLDLGPDYKADKEVQTTVKTDDGVYIIYKDGTTSLIGGGKSNSNLKSGAPSWEQYLAAAEDTAQMNFNNDMMQKLKAQYDKTYVLTDTSDLTATEKKKLEQAGLLGASRQEQLDFLYGGDGGEIDFGA